MSAVIGIVGTAGRKDDAARLDRAAYDAMYARALAAIDAWRPVSGVSGGAAYADHLAVRAFLDDRLPALTLYLPAAFRAGAFLGSGDGATSNHYHAGFSSRCGIDSLSEIAQASARGANLVVVPEGFKARNLRIGADATHLLAFTFGTSPNAETDFAGAVPSTVARTKRGGTAHCWDNARSRVRRHVDLSVLLGLRAEAGPEPDLFAAAAGPR